MQNSAYGTYPTPGYYTNPPTATAGTPSTTLPAYGATSTNPYGNAFSAPATSDQYSSYTTTQPTYDTKSQQPGYYPQSQPPAANPPGANSVPPSTGYGNNTEGYGANNYYQNQPATQPPGSNVGAQPVPSGYGTYGAAPPPGPSGPNGQSVGWQRGPPPQSNYNAPNGYNNYGNGMARGVPPNGPPGNFRGGSMGSRNSGPVFKGGPMPPRDGPGMGGGYMPPNDADNDTIFISGMPTDVTEEQLSNYFGSIGVIKMDKNQKQKIWIYRDKNSGEGKGEATLTYEDPHSAKSAIQWFNGKEFSGTNKIINVEFAQRKMPAGGDFKSRGGRGGGGGGRGRGGGRGETFVRQGDWRCPSCNNNNFSWREQCNRCKMARPADAPPPPGGPMDHRRQQMGGPVGGSPMGRRPMGPGGPMRGPPGDRPPRGDRPMRGRGGPGRGLSRGGGPMRGAAMGGDRRPKPY